MLLKAEGALLWFCLGGRLDGVARVHRWSLYSRQSMCTGDLSFLLDAMLCSYALASISLDLGSISYRSDVNFLHLLFTNIMSMTERNIYQWGSNIVGPTLNL